MTDCYAVTNCPELARDYGLSYPDVLRELQLRLPYEKAVDYAATKQVFTLSYDMPRQAQFLVNSAQTYEEKDLVVFSLSYLGLAGQTAARPSRDLNAQLARAVAIQQQSYDTRAGTSPNVDS